MGAEEERIFVKSIGNPANRDEWSKKVDKMSDEKVIEVYLAAQENLDEKKAQES